MACFTTTRTVPSALLLMFFLFSLRHRLTDRNMQISYSHSLPLSTTFKLERSVDKDEKNFDSVATRNPAAIG